MPVATNDDLTGFGFSPQQSALLGGNPAVLTCTGTASTTAATLKSRNTELSPASSQTGAIPPSDAKVMAPYFLTNAQSTTAVVYVPAGHTLNTSGGASFNLAQYKAAIFWQYKPKNWTYVILA
jgi:hypothetical protein